MILIHGAVADASYFSETAAVLREFFDVITYDRRGNSRSSCSPDAAYHIQDQTDDVVALIERLGLRNVILVGHSAGGIMAIEAFRRITSRVSHVIIYETPLLALVGDAEKERLISWVHLLEEMNERGEHKQTAREFGLSIGELDPRAPRKSSEEKEKDRVNFGHFINHEFHDFSFYEPNLDFLKANAKYITLMDGDRNHGHYFHTGMENLHTLTGSPLVHTAGCHNAPYDVPESFATALIGIVARCHHAPLSVKKKPQILSGDYIPSGRADDTEE